MASAGEKYYGLPVMHFYANGIPNGAYEVIANLYTDGSGRNMRYYYGYSETDPEAHFVDTVGGAGGSDQRLLRSEFPRISLDIEERFDRAGRETRIHTSS